MKWPRPAGEPDNTPERRSSDEAEETPSWLSSSDLASSPRPWERDDLVGLVESVATGQREIVAPPVNDTVDTPMYQQLRSERSEELAPVEERSSRPSPDEPRSEAAVMRSRSEALTPPIAHEVSSRVEPSPVERDEPAPPLPVETRSEPDETPRDRVGPGESPTTHDDASYGTESRAEGRHTPQGSISPQEPSSRPGPGAVEPDPAPFHVEHQGAGNATASVEEVVTGDDPRPMADGVPGSRAEPVRTSEPSDPVGAVEPGVAEVEVEDRPLPPTDDTVVAEPGAAPQVPSGETATPEVGEAPSGTTTRAEDASHDEPSDEPEQEAVVDDLVAARAATAEAAESLIGDPAGPEDDDPLLDVPTVPAAGASAATEALSGLEEGTRHATVICVANQKGGVGKTTTTVSLGAALAQEGAQVLVVDLDPQGNATTGLGLRAQEGSPSTYRVIVEQMDVEDASEPTAVKGLHVLPSSLDLAGAEIELVPAFSREMRLKNALDAVRDLYDVILIDCPPSLGLLTINAFVAADQVLVPIQCEYYALEGLGQLMRTVKLVSDSLNKELVLGGVVLTMFDGRTNLSQQVVDEVRAYFGDTAYQTIVPRTVRLSEAPSYGQPIGVFDPSSRGARSYQRLAREVARRLGVELESQDVSPLDRLLGTVSTAGPTGTGMAQDDEDGREGALPTDLDEDLADLTEATKTPSSATAPGPDHVEHAWSQTAGGSATGTEGDR